MMQEGYTVEYCSTCRTKTWHYDRKCEWCETPVTEVVKPKEMRNENQRPCNN